MFKTIILSKNFLGIHTKNKNIVLLFILFFYIHEQASSVENDLPYNELSSTRTKLRDIYRSLLIEDLEVALDQKIEQELWNQCYKNPINQLQEKQKVIYYC
jgi:hypothetical protein